MLFNSSIGIEINEHQVNIVYLKGSFKGVSLAAVSNLQLEADKSMPDRQADIVDFINGFIREERITASDLFIGIPGDHLMMREIEFPLAVRENLRTTLEYEIEKYIPLAAEDIYFDFHIIAESKETEKLQLLLVAVKKHVFSYYLEIAERIDQGVSGIGIVPAALTNYFFHHQAMPRKQVILLYFQNLICEVVVIKNRALAYAKSMAVSESFDTPINAQVTRLRDIFCAEEEAPALAVYGIAPSDDRIMPLLPEYEIIPRDESHTNGYDDQYIPAYGFALSGIGEVPLEINLLPPRLRRKPDKTGFYVMLVLAALLVLGGALWAGSNVVKQRRIVNELNVELTQLHAKAAEIEQIQSHTLEMKKNMAYISSLRPGKVFVVEILTELSTKIPMDAWLTDLKISGDKVNIYGVAASATELIALLEKSAFFENVEFISTIRKDRDGKEIYRIGCTIQAEKQEK